MKKAIYTTILLFCSVVAFAQAPQKFNYQAVARNVQGAVLNNQNVKIRASILNGSANGTSQYSETHSKMTNPRGLFDLAIGGGSVIGGSFGSITWESGDKYLKIEMDPSGGNNYSLVGTNQLLSVPYASYAENTANATDKIAIIEYKISGNGSNNGSGQTTNAAQWNKRLLNTETKNYIPESLTFNDQNDVIVLQPGKYLVRAHGTANYCNGNVLRIRNTLTNVDEIYGTPGFSKADDVDGENNYSYLEGVLTVTAINSQYVLEHWIQSNPPSGGSAIGKIFGDYPNLPTGFLCAWARIVIQKIE